MKIRFLADADLDLTIVLALRRREPGLDFETAAFAGLQGLPDTDVLTIAAEHGRVLVTHDRRTMPEHFGTFISTKKSPGVILMPQKLSVSQVVDELTLIWALTDASEWTNRIFCLPL